VSIPKERPILFSGPMVRAILDGRKTQTRRIIKPQPELDRGGLLHADFGIKYRNGDLLLLDANHDGKFAETCKCCPYGIPGERLWVRETWRLSGDLLLATEEMTTSNAIKTMKKRHGRMEYDEGEVCYAADEYQNEHPGEYKPSIFMPRIASRITLEITGVRVERLNDISEADAKAEGVSNDMPIAWQTGDDTPRGMFGELWQSINGPDSWDANPWVWVIEFCKVEAAK
jgi:hypothetical protein